jgi:hypothetical protein
MPSLQRQCQIPTHQSTPYAVEMLWWCYLSIEEISATTEEDNDNGVEHCATLKELFLLQMALHLCKTYF